jgi:hypothetical protein
VRAAPYASPTSSTGAPRATPCSSGTFARLPSEAIAQRLGRDLAHGGLPVADVHDRAAPLRIELGRGVGEQRAQIRGPSPLHRGQPLEPRAALAVVERGQRAAAVDHRVQLRVARPERRAIVGPQLREHGLREAAGDAQRARLGRGRGIHDDGEIDPGRRRRAPGRPHGHQQVVGLLARDLRDEAGLGLLGRVLGRHSVRRAEGDRLLLPRVEELDGEIRERHDVERLHDDPRAVARAAHARAHPLRPGAREVDAHRQLLDARQRAARALGGHGIHVQAPVGLWSLPGQPLGVARDHAPLRARRDGVQARRVDAGAGPHEQRRILGRALVDVALVLRERRRALLDLAPHEVAVAVDAEALQHGARGRAEAEEALDDVRRRVHEGLVDLGHGEVVVDRHAHVEALHDEREAGLALVAGGPRADRADAERSRLARGVGRGEAARPVVPGDLGGARRGAVDGDREPLPGAGADGRAHARRSPQHVHVGLAARADVDAGARVGQLDVPVRRVHDGGRSVVGVDERAALRDLDRSGVEEELGGPGDQQHRPPIPPQPRETPGGERDGLALGDALAGIRRARPLAHGRDGYITLHRPHLGERVGARDDLGLRGRHAAVAGDGDDQGEQEQTGPLRHPRGAHHRPAQTRHAPNGSALRRGEVRKGHHAAGGRVNGRPERSGLVGDRPNLVGERLGLRGERFHLPGERFHLPGERFHLPRERFHLPRERFRLPGERFHLPGERFHLPRERFVLLGERVVLLGERFHLPADRLVLPGERFHLPAERFVLPGERFHLPAERFVLLGERFHLPAERFVPLGERSILVGVCSSLLAERSHASAQGGSRGRRRRDARLGDPLHCCAMRDRVRDRDG